MQMKIKDGFEPYWQQGKKIQGKVLLSVRGIL